MSFNVSSNASSPTKPVEVQISTLSAGYTDSSVAHAVVDDLERAGLRPILTVPLGPWTMSALPDPSRGLFERPVGVAATGAFVLGLLTSFGSLIWLDGRHMWLYAGLGLFVGALTGWIGSAIAAGDHHAREGNVMAHPGGGLTVEVEADEPGKARLAEIVMGRHDPTIFNAQTRPGPRPASERVMWHHDEGLSPLQAMSMWLDDSDPSSGPPRGRHLAAQRIRS